MTSIYDNGAEYDSYILSADTGGETDFYASFAPSGGSVLELACGTGRLALPLSGRGLQVTGLDNSPAMLAAAEAKASENALRPRFVTGDVREFALDSGFDLIFLPNNSLGHLHTLPDIQACFKSVLRHFAPRGRFIVDMFNPSLPLLLREPGRRYPLTSCQRPDGKTVTVSETVFYDAAAQILHALWHYEVENEPADIRPLDLRMFFPQELDALLSLSGFTIEAKYGGFDRSSFLSASRQQVIVCRAS